MALFVESLPRSTPRWRRHQPHARAPHVAPRRRPRMVMVNGGNLGAVFDQGSSAIASTDTAEEHVAISDLRRVAGQPEAIDLLQMMWQTGASELDDAVGLTSALFSFTLDDFQLDAVDALSKGESVVVSAPTGSGKTVIGEVAVYLALSRGLRAFYTTPLKALSNQKFNDFKKQFGERRVGLLTGDVSYNRDADVVVMTTEVYRNMLYASESGDEVGGTAPGVVDDVHAVIFDEFHYMNDPDRGTVWEESVIISPKRMLLVALSATMRNVDEVRDWFEAVHGPTRLILSTFRPVPLEFLFCNRDGMNALFSSSTAKRSSFASTADVRGINPKVLSPEILQMAAARVEISRRSRGGASSARGGGGLGRTRRRGRATASEISEEVQLILKESSKSGRRLPGMNQRHSYEEVPSFGYVVRLLRRRSMLPAIIFLFSRSGCDRAAATIGGERAALLTEAEAVTLNAYIDNFVAKHPKLVPDELLRLARRGIASHHAGLLPLWKAVIERLFQEGLIKVVFATETLAAGINMPARTTAITALSKRAGEGGIVDLSTSALLQMAGRAGRRGKDKKGFCVIVRSPFEGAEDAFRVLTRDVDALKSTFAPKYGMVLNLLQRRDLESSKQLVENSFGAFLVRGQAQGSVARSGAEGDGGAARADAVKARARQFVQMRAMLREVAPKPMAQYYELRLALRTERKIYKRLIRAYAGAERDSLLLALTQPSAVGARVEFLCADCGQPASALAVLQLQTQLNVPGAAIHPSTAELIRAGVLLGRWTRGDDATANAATDAAAAQLLVVGDDRKLYALDTEWVINADFDAGLEVSPEEAAIGSEWTQRLASSSEEARGNNPRVWECPPDLRALAERLSALQGGVATTPPGHLIAQRAVVDNVVQRINAHELHKRANREELLTAKRACEQLKQHLSAEEIDEAEEKYGTEKTMVESIWKEFLSAADVLQEFGFVSESFTVQGLGRLGAALRGENELWLSIVLMSDHVADLQPHHFCAVLSALLAEGARRDQVINFELSQEVARAVEEVAPLSERLRNAQQRRGLDYTLTLDASDAPLVEAWANGIDWNELMEGTSLQEGDVCRRLRRVMDLLRQIPRLPLLAESMRTTARRALTLMDRFPVADDVTYMAARRGEDDGEEFDEADGEGGGASLPEQTEEDYIEALLYRSAEDESPADELREDKPTVGADDLGERAVNDAAVNAELQLRPEPFTDGSGAEAGSLESDERAELEWLRGRITPNKTLAVSSLDDLRRVLAIRESIWRNDIVDADLRPEYAFVRNMNVDDVTADDDSGEGLSEVGEGDKNTPRQGGGLSLIDPGSIPEELLLTMEFSPPRYWPRWPLSMNKMSVSTMGELREVLAVRSVLRRLDVPNAELDFGYVFLRRLKLEDIDVCDGSVSRVSDSDDDLGERDGDDDVEWTDGYDFEIVHDDDDEA